MIQTIIVTAIVAAAVFLTARRIVRTVRGKEGCGCGCANCPKGGKECRCDKGSDGNNREGKGC